MPSWVAGVGLSSPDASKLRSPDSAFSVSSTSSDTRKMAINESGSGMATEGLHVVATRGSLRDDSAPSRGSQSTASLPPLEDATARDRSPRRRDPIEDGSDGASSSFGPRRSREGRARSPLPISDCRVQRVGGSRDSSRRRRLLDASADDGDDFEDTLENDLAAELARDTMTGDVVESHFGYGSRAPTGVDDISMPSGQAQPLGPPVAHVMAAQNNNDFGN